jgi:dihydroxy-acid dehydratase
MSGNTDEKKLPDQLWLDDLDDMDMTAMYLERYFSFGIPVEESTTGYRPSSVPPLRCLSLPASTS